MAKNKLFIIGNGFDLDLGWKVKFSDFYTERRTFPSEKSFGCPLRRFIDMWGKTENWFDLERYIGMFVDESNQFVPRDNEKDLRFFDKLRDNLKRFIENKTNKSISKTKVNKKIEYYPLSYRMLGWFLENQLYTFYTFNYSSLKNVMEQIQLENTSITTDMIDDLNKEIIHIHGAIESDDIIVGSNLEHAVTGYNRMLKKEMICDPSNIYDALREAEQVVFFGLSLSADDYRYFKQFFDDYRDGKSCKCKKIIFIVRNDKSMFKIKDSLVRNDQKNDLLKDRLKFYFIEKITESWKKGSKSKLYNELLNDLK